jgi:hypothetical protein
VPLSRCLAPVSYLGNIDALEPHLIEITLVITLQIHHTSFYGVDMRTLSHSDLTMAWGWSYWYFFWECEPVVGYRVLQCMMYMLDLIYNLDYVEMSILLRRTEE